MKRSLVPFIVTACLIAGWFAILWSVYLKGQKKEAIIYTEIPETTVRFINGLMETLDQYLTFDSDPLLSDWENDENFGETDNDGFAKIEDDNFIIYFVPEEMESIKSRKILNWAYDAIVPLENLMGKYFYPKDMKGRKLPIYIANSQSLYTRIIGNLLNKPDYKEKFPTWGMYIGTYSVYGCLTKGIVLHPDIWNKEKDAKEVLWHEMNHYVFYSSLDYSKEINPYSWVSEGLAEYFSKEPHKLSDLTIKRLLNERLNHSFTIMMDNYQGGQYVYSSIEYNFGLERVRNFIRTIYSNKMDSVYQKSLNISEKVVEQQWKKYIRSIPQ